MTDEGIMKKLRDEFVKTALEIKDKFPNRFFNLILLGSDTIAFSEEEFCTRIAEITMRPFHCNEKENKTYLAELKHLLKTGEWKV